ncbi:hypothetical protein [Mangrovimonas sp. TPBH4]|uniref:hypothetical protein n=1 Tax=Mangrovimonas sp. TPBH4 TaxID=1645914 RepID=UPI0006B56354|nr:hypothetical protein [Mangrovimonas sp. TPBH4]
MKNYFFLILILIAISSCKNKTTDSKLSTTEIKSQEKQFEQPDIVSVESKKPEDKITSDCLHPEYFDFKNHKEYCITDTINLDLNGNGIIEKIYFDNKSCPKLIIEEKGQDLISIGCGIEKYKGFPNAIGWVDLWCIVSDKETFEILVEDGELIGDKTVTLERPSLYVGKEEAGGGIITYKNGELYWIHQSD